MACASSESSGPADMPSTDIGEGIRRRTSVFRGSLVVGAARLAQLAASFLIGVFVSRALGPSGKGQLALLQQVPALAALLLGFGIANASTYFVGRRRRTAEEAVSDSTSFALLVSLLGVPVLVLLMRFAVPALSGVTTTLLLLAALAVPLSLVTSMLSAILTGQGRLVGQSAGHLTSTLLSVGLVLACVLANALSVDAVVVIGLASSAIGVIVLALATKIGRLVRPSVIRLREEAGYARRTFVSSIAGYLELRQDTIMLGILSTAGAVGVYSVGVSFAELLWHAPQTIGAALSARAYQESQADGAALTASVTRLTTAVLLAVTLVLAFVLRPLIIAVFGAAFAPAAMVFVLLAPGVLLAGISHNLAAYLAAHGVLFPGMSSLAVVLNLILNLVLIPLFGYYGAAAASSISYAAGAIYVIAVFSKRSDTGIRDVLLPRIADVRLASAAVSLLFRRRPRTR